MIFRTETDLPQSAKIQLVQELQWWKEMKFQPVVEILKNITLKLRSRQTRNSKQMSDFWLFGKRIFWSLQLRFVGKIDVEVQKSPSERVGNFLVSNSEDQLILSWSTKEFFCHFVDGLCEPLIYRFFIRPTMCAVYCLPSCLATKITSSCVFGFLNVKNAWWATNAFPKEWM